ncbi:MAG: Rab family GTPase [Methanobacteriota archaeon]
MVSEESPSYILKFALVGDPMVGKTSLVTRFVIDKYDDSYIQTIGAKVMKKIVKIKTGAGTEVVAMMVWDVMGQKHFKIIESVAFAHVKGALVVCDCTRKETLDNASYWVESLWKVSGEVPIIILGNKSDLEGEAAFDENDVAELAKKYQCGYHLTSAKTGANVELAFEQLAKLSLEGT